MSETNYSHLPLIEQLLHTQSYDALEAVTLQELQKSQLLSAHSLDAARMQRLPATVIYLASLAIENEIDIGANTIWLAVYQSIGRRAETPAFQQLSRRSALQAAASSLIHQCELDKKALMQCHGELDEWLAAAELLVDYARLDQLKVLIAELARRKADVESWLYLVRTLFLRQAFVKNVDPADLLAESYLSIRDNLRESNPVIANVRSSLALYASHAYAISGKHEKTILWAQQATSSQDKVPASINMARAHCFEGRFPETLQWLDDLLGQLVKPEVRQSHKEEQKHPDQKPQFDVMEASQALLDLREVLLPLGVKPFLVSGTLLGYAREGQLLAHDKDIDVGIIGWEDQFDVVNALLQSGLFGVDFTHVKGRRAYHLVTQHLRSGVMIDIFIYREENGSLVTGVESYFGYLQKFAFTPFDVKAVKFLGVDFFVPSDVEKNLEENFGNWRQSDPGYISHLESPSTMDVGGDVYQVVGRLRALEAIQKGNLEKLERVIHLMNDQKHQPLGMSEATLAQLRSIQAQEQQEVLYEE